LTHRDDPTHIYLYMYIYISDSLRAGRSGDRIRVRARYPAPFQTGPGAHPASWTLGTGSFPRVRRRGRGVNHPSSSSNEVKESVYSDTSPRLLRLHDRLQGELSEWPSFYDLPPWCRAVSPLWSKQLPINVTPEDKHRFCIRRGRADIWAPSNQANSEANGGHIQKYLYHVRLPKVLHIFVKRTSIQSFHLI
jgi:hypothetical protein